MLGGVRSPDHRRPPMDRVKVAQDPILPLRRIGYAVSIEQQQGGTIECRCYEGDEMAELQFGYVFGKRVEFPVQNLVGTPSESR